MRYWAKKTEWRVSSNNSLPSAGASRTWTAITPIPPAAAPALRQEGQFIEELLSGEVVTTPLRQHFETEKTLGPVSPSVFIKRQTPSIKSDT